jgi:antitoxin (DNA-binding transcriptional repressor) of toxin-antitoxin stability system
MPQFNLAEAKARFSELVQKAMLGEEVIVPPHRQLRRPGIIAIRLTAS